MIFVVKITKFEKSFDKITLSYQRFSEFVKKNKKNLKKIISQCYRTMIISQRIAVTLGIIEFVCMLIVNIDTLTEKYLNGSTMRFLACG